MDHDGLLTRAGITEQEWQAFSDALDGVNGETWRRLQNGVGSQVLMVEQVTRIEDGPGGAVTAASYGAQHTTAFGDLT
ncbi:MAG: hypothetical protein EKK29_01335 [Hyphomicrobiales bacterium]|nr:MAG: hypothetical protein EKK29_01335 [Hyphomicrobiales bacterium]